MATKQKARKTSGRGDRRKTTSTRITPETRAQLEEAAAQTGRSLAQEIEFRLEKSFLTDDARFAQFGGKEKFTLCRLFAVCADQLEPVFRDILLQGQKEGRLRKEKTERTWVNDWTLFQMAAAWWVYQAKRMIFEVPIELEDLFRAPFEGPEDPSRKSLSLVEFGRALDQLVVGKSKRETE